MKRYIVCYHENVKFEIQIIILAQIPKPYMYIIFLNVEGVT